MSKRYTIAIIGAGPGGLSAAARAAQTATSHIVLEAAPHLANTIYRYQKGKHVMAEPGQLPLRAAIGFEAGTRERILSSWQRGIEQSDAKVRYNAEVVAIEGEQGNFQVKLADGAIVHAEFVVLCIGLQGNLRRMDVPGDSLPEVQYQLDDPDAYRGETIVVVGAGDAAIENALALAVNNTVVILNRRDEFTRAKEGNLRDITRAIDSDQIDCLYNASPRAVTAAPDGHPSRKRLRFEIKTKDGMSEVFCDRIVARLGALPPRAFVEACGVVFPSDDPAAVPSVSPRYESNVPGLYIIGALAGYPLIRQCINQGYEVVEFICGREVEPADEGLLRAKFAGVQGLTKVNLAIVQIRSNIPLFAGLTPLQLREFLLDSEIRTPAAGEVVVQLNDYTDTFFSVLRGAVYIHIDPDDLTNTVKLGVGKFFGEMSLISGRRRAATIVAGQDCVLIETPRRSMNKLIQSVESVRRAVDETFLLRAIRMHIAPDVPEDDLIEVARTARQRVFAPGDALFNEGDPATSLHLIRSGSVTIAHQIGGREMVIAYLPSGNYVGELALLTDSPRTATVRAAVVTETIELPGVVFRELLACFPELDAELKARAQARLSASARSRGGKTNAGNMIEFLVAQGIGEATDVLLIDESLCVDCDNCEKACADTHKGTSLLDRRAGPTFASVHVPTSCRHCEHPHCMKDCPPDAIHRTPEGEVYIADNCIGCGNCEKNCPYGVIQMATKGEAEKPSLWKWLLFGTGPAPGEEFHSADKTAAKTAVKCDMCKDQAAGPACVRACPTGAAIRVSPAEFMAIAR